MMIILSFSKRKVICRLDQCIKAKIKSCILKIAYCPEINFCIGFWNCNASNSVGE